MENTFILLFIVMFPMVCSFVGYSIGKKDEFRRDIFNILITGINFLVVAQLYRIIKLQPIDLSINYIMGTGLHLKLDGFRYIFVWITSFIWFLTTIYSVRFLKSRKNRNRYYMFFMLTLGSTLGVFISENFLNLFTFFEIMSFTSYALIIHDEDEYSHEAGYTYIIMAVGGGLLLLMGLFLLYNYTQTLDIGKLYLAVEGIGDIKYVISILIIIGFGIKAGMVPLHIWLPKAYTAAPAPGSAVLSAILSKTGIFGIILTIDIMLKGDIYVSTAIIVLGFINMLTGGFLAMFQRNIKRILAYSSMSQIGYMFLGIGLAGLLKEHGGIAIYGTLIHAVNHAFQKGLLFMGAGVMYTLANDLSINKMIGIGRRRIALMAVFAIGIAGTMGIPGLNGFLSKTLLHEALIEAEHMYGGTVFTISELLFTLGSSFTVAYLLKLFFTIFIDGSHESPEDSNIKPPREFAVPLSILSIAIVYMGIRPGAVLDIFGGALSAFEMPSHLDINFYNYGAIKSSLTVIALGTIIYLVFVRKCLLKRSGNEMYYINPIENWFNIERNIYRPLGGLIFNICTIIFKVVDTFIVGSASYLSSAFERLGKIEIEKKSSFKSILDQRLKESILFKDSSPRDNLASTEQSQRLCSIRERIGQIAFKMNSLTYSIFIFAIVLVICLFALVS